MVGVIVVGADRRAAPFELKINPQYAEIKTQHSKFNTLLARVPLGDRHLLWYVMLVAMVQFFGNKKNLIASLAG
jgi:uncharacterized membrane protein (DUF485 family)